MSRGIAGSPIATLVSLAAAFWLGSGCAQKVAVRSFDRLQQEVRTGQTVYVVEASGQEVRGKILEISHSALTVSDAGARTRFAAEDIRAVDRYGDPLWNGLAIGLGVGAGMALLSDPREVQCPDGSSGCTDAQAGARLAAVALGGALGAGIDALSRRRTRVYLSPEPGASTYVLFAPYATLHGAGVRVTLRF
jgi:hypothetical protein